MMTAEQLQKFMQHLIPTIQNQFVQQAQQQAPGDGATTTTKTPSGRKVTFTRSGTRGSTIFAGGEEVARVVLGLSHGHGYPECDGVRAIELDRGEWRGHLQGDHGEGSGRDPERAIQRDGDDRQGDLPLPGAQHRGRGKDGCEGCGERGRVCGLFKAARQVLQKDLSENHADSQGVHVPEPGQGREVAHLGHFPVGGQMGMQCSRR